MPLSFSASASRQNCERVCERRARSIFSTSTLSHQHPIRTWPSERTPGTAPCLTPLYDLTRKSLHPVFNSVKRRYGQGTEKAEREKGFRIYWHLGSGANRKGDGSRASSAGGGPFEFSAAGAGGEA